MRIALVTQLFPPETFRNAIAEALQSKASLLSLNEDAFKQGLEAVAVCGD